MAPGASLIYKQYYLHNNTILMNACPVCAERTQWQSAQASEPSGAPAFPDSDALFSLRGVLGGESAASHDSCPSVLIFALLAVSSLSPVLIPRPLLRALGVLGGEPLPSPNPFRSSGGASTSFEPVDVPIRTSPPGPFSTVWRGGSGLRIVCLAVRLGRGEVSAIQKHRER